MPKSPTPRPKRPQLISNASVLYDNGTAYGGSTATLALTANRLYGVPFYLDEPVTLVKIGTTVTTLAASSNIRIGIFELTAGVPGALVSDSGAVSSASNGAKSLTISVPRAPGYHVLGLVSDGTPTIIALTSMINLLGMDGGNSVANGHWFAAFTYGALPATFPAATLAAGPSPRIWTGI